MGEGEMGETRWSHSDSCERVVGLGGGGKCMMLNVKVIDILAQLYISFTNLPEREHNHQPIERQTSMASSHRLVSSIHSLTFLGGMGHINKVPLS